jgi:hypothetical protein
MTRAVPYLSTLAAAALLACFSVHASAAPEPALWSTELHLPGVVDLAGPRSDGRLVVSGGDRLYLLDRGRKTLEPFATGPGGYRGGKGDEPYLALSTGDKVASAACSFQPDDLYVIQQGPHDVIRLDVMGRVHSFAHVDGVESLGGIAFDTTGRFGHRLLVIGPNRGFTVVAAIDCRGKVEHLTEVGPAMEGGIAVAPAGFGAFAGDLIAPDELGGVIRAVRPDGSTAVVVPSGLPAGGDIGVEGVGFVPSGFAAGGTAFFADRATPGNPHPGTGSLLNLGAETLFKAGGREGDLLAATEGGATAIAIRCTSSCQTFRVASGPKVAHGEGHLLVVADHPPARPGSLAEARDLGLAAQRQAQITRAAVAVLLVGGVLLAVLLGLLFRRRRRRPTQG